MRFVTSAMRFDLRFMFYAQIAKTTGMKLSEARKRQLVLELTSGLMTLFWLLDQRDHDSDFVRRVSDMLQRAQHLLDEMSPVSLGRGTASWRQLQLVQPKSEMYGFCVERPMGDRGGTRVFGCASRTQNPNPPRGGELWISISEMAKSKIRNPT